MFKSVKLKDISKIIGSGITPFRNNELFWKNGTIPWVKTEQLGEHKIYETTEKITRLWSEELQSWIIRKTQIQIQKKKES